MGSSLSLQLKPKKQSKEVPDGESTANTVLAAASGVSILVLETLQDIARFASAPYLSDIASLALGILQAVQTSKDTKRNSKNWVQIPAGSYMPSTQLVRAS
ncbi:hypothetical protein PQX77_002597 [Marasmius sp. AFHP31]|nr:hypothetical protein PQX77_002597 [Marasmius sp. AFHP31]